MYHYQHHIGDFNNATRHLSRLERSLYRDLLELYYDTECQLPNDLPWICRKIIANDCSTDVERMLNEFFTKTPNGWYHDRCELEIEKFRASNSQKSIAGRASAAKREAKKQQALNGNPTPVETPLNGTPTNHKPITNNHKPYIKPTSAHADSIEFDRFWIAYPRKTAKSAAIKAWSKLKPDGDLVEKIIGHCMVAFSATDQQFIPHPATYLNGRRWEDEHPESNIGFIKMHTDRSWRDGIDGHAANGKAETERDQSVVATVVAGEPKNAVNAKQGAL